MEKKIVTKLMKINYEILDNIISLRKKKGKSKKDYRAYNVAFNNAMKKFGYIPERHAARYRIFPNYNDIRQEANIGLAKAIDAFNPERSKNFFKLANWYCGTRVKRAANKHGVVKIAILSKEKLIINRLGDLDFSDMNQASVIDMLEKQDLISNVKKAVASLKEPYKSIITLHYGINNDKEITLNKISKILKLEKEETESLLKEAHERLICSEQITSIVVS